MDLSMLVDDLFQAARTGDADRLRAMLAEHPQLANMENGDGLTPLGYAAHYGSKEAVQALLEFGAEINATSHSRISFIPSNTALHAAIAGERSMDVIRLLLASGARTDIRDSNGHTCLHSAAFHDDSEALIWLLIEHGADPNAVGEQGETALSLAEERGNGRVAELLRGYGGQA